MNLVPSAKASGRSDMAEFEAEWSDKDAGAVATVSSFAEDHLRHQPVGTLWPVIRKRAEALSPNGHLDTNGRRAAKQVEDAIAELPKAVAAQVLYPERKTASAAQHAVTTALAAFHQATAHLEKAQESTDSSWRPINGSKSGSHLTMAVRSRPTTAGAMSDKGRELHAMKKRLRQSLNHKSWIEQVTANANQQTTPPE